MNGAARTNALRAPRDEGRRCLNGCLHPASGGMLLDT